MRPLIGLTARRGDPEWVEQHVHYYLQALRRAGADIAVLAPQPEGEAETNLDELSGLLLSGGGDVDPAYYGEPMDGSEAEWMDLARDELELGLSRAAIDRRMPVFGICRGHQVLNIVLGGGLVQHLPFHRVGGGPGWAQHVVRIAPDTQLHEIFGGRDEIIVNSRHHQAVTRERLAPGLVASAITWPEDGVIEGIEAPQLGWVLGVQWHPERVPEVPAEHAALFAAFVDAARRYRAPAVAVSGSNDFPDLSARADSRSKRSSHTTQVVTTKASRLPSTTPR